MACGLVAPRLSSTWRSLLRGEKDAVADLEALVASREVSLKKKARSRTTWSWRQQSHRFGGAKAGRDAFDAFTSAVSAAVQSGDDAVGETYYEALSSSIERSTTRCELEDAFGRMSVKSWQNLIKCFETLKKCEIRVEKQDEWTLSVDYVDPFGSIEESSSAMKKKQDTATWLVEIVEALPERQLSTVDAALAARAAAQMSDETSLQARLFELFGYSEAALHFMTELYECRDAVAALDPTEIRGLAKNDQSTIQQQPVVRSSSRQRQSTSVQLIGAQSKQTKKKQQQKAVKAEAAKQLKNSILSSSKYGELLAALGISLNDDEVKTTLSHADALLSDREREYHEQRTGLPKNAQRRHGEGYEEVILEPPPRLDTPRPGELIPINTLPAFARACFPKSTKNLNRVQSAVYETCFNSPKNALICAPTGAGKTYVALLCVLELVERIAGELADAVVSSADKDDELTRQQKEQVALALREHKIVYIAPLKALAQEVVTKFSDRLRPLGLVVKELTGDTQLTKREADAAHVLVATPEKWDVVTRKQGTEGSLASRCRLLIIDEIHLLAEERGAVLECIVARTRRLVESSQKRIRLVGLSATLPNYLDVAEFLACDKDGVFFFGQEYRPVPLKQTFVGVTAGAGDNPARARLKMAAKLDELAYEKALDAIDRGHQVMIFVHSRRDTSKTARYLRDRAARQGRDGVFLGIIHEDNGNNEKHKKDFSQALSKVRHSEMRELAASGLTVHHAGMCRADRSLAEDMFARGAVRVLCCTATLAWGVNLPARAVICRGTEIYDAQRGGHVDLSMLDVLQIFGRAGRPQFDDFGEATLLTSIGSLPDYLRKLARASPIESCLIPKLADALNAEVAAGTVSSVHDGAAWLDHTFLAVRLRKNPHAYGVITADNEPSAAVADHTHRLLRTAAEVLDDAKMARFDRRSGALAGTDVGRVGSFYYLRHDSVRAFGTALEEHASDASILAAVCSAHEFDQLQTRSDEIQELDTLRLGPACPLHGLRAGVVQSSAAGTDNISALLPKPLAKIIDEPAGKAACLFQAHVSRCPIQSFTLSSDAAYVAKNAARVCRALFELAVKARFGGLAERLLQFAIAVERRVWWFQTPIRQLADVEPSQASRQKNFPEDALKHLENKNVSLDRLLVDCGTTHDLTALVRNQRAATSFRIAAQRIPRLDLECEVVPITRSVLRFVVTITPDYEWLSRIHGSGPEPWWLWVEDSRTGRLLHSEPIVLMPARATSSKKHGEPEATKAAFTLAVSEPMPPMFFVRAISDRWLGATALTEVSSLGITLPSTAAKHTTLLPLHPLPTSALGVDAFAQLYRFSHFNPVQTQLFYCLYHTDRNVLLGAPTGSGKTCVAELAVMRMLNQRNAPSSGKEKKTKAVYVAPLKALARERLKDWRAKFGGMGLSVLELTGDATPDARALREADILVTTPEKFDGITRQFKRRDWVRDTALVILDEIHLLGEDRGPVIEAIVTRARFVAAASTTDDNDKQKLEPIRFIGLSTAISNAGDLADWLGVDESMGLYNFRPSVRPVPMETHIAGFPGKAYCPRMATMNKPCYKAIVEHADGRPALVFVASRRQTRLTALELISIAGQDDAVRGGAAALWVDAARLSTPDELETLAQSCEDAALRETLPLGIGLHHAGLAEHDRDTVERVFAAGKIRVLVCTATLAWGVNFPARLVVVKGTEFFDAKQRKYVDFPITDVLQMMGRAGRPQFDDTGVAVILVHAPKKDFYRKFLYEPFPVESHLREHLHNLLNAEVCATGSILDVDDAVAFLRYSYFYRRLLQNPSYYHLDRHDPASITTYLKQLVAATFDDLSAAGAIELEDDGFTVKPATLGRIAAYYYLDYKTTRDASDALDALEDDLYNSQERESAAIQLLCGAREFDELPVRHNEDILNEELAADLGIACSAGEDPHVKAQLLIHARLRAFPLPIADYVTDTRSVLEQASRVLAALIDVAADAGALYTTLALCHLSQCLGTKVSANRDELCQLPGVHTDEMALDLRSRIGLKRDQGIQAALRKRNVLLKHIGHEMNKKSLQIELLPTQTRLQATVEDSLDTDASGAIVECDATYSLRISLELLGAAASNNKKYQRRERLESWWLILAEDDELIALKRVSLPRRSQKLDATLVFAAPEMPGSSTLILHAVAHDFRGFDASINIPLLATISQTGADRAVSIAEVEPPQNSSSSQS